MSSAIGHTLVMGWQKALNDSLNPSVDTTVGKEIASVGHGVAEMAKGAGALAVSIGAIGCVLWVAYKVLGWIF